MINFVQISDNITHIVNEMINLSFFRLHDILKALNNKIIVQTNEIK